MPNQIEENIFLCAGKLLITKGISEGEAQQIMALIKDGSKGLSDAMYGLIVANNENN